MINLTIDIGNSKAKCAIWDSYKMLFHEVLSESGFDSLKNLVGRYGVESAIYANVGKDADYLIKVLECTKLENICEFSFDQTKSNFKINYSSSLGVDRLAAFIGAIEMFPSAPLLIVDSGTALTIDVVNADNEFCGGNISLGLNSRLSAIHDKTARLPLVNISMTKDFFGDDTESAILNGVVNGIVGEILYSIHKAKELYNIKLVILTGGEAKFLIPTLQKENIECIYDEFLVLRGLNSFMQKELSKTPTHPTM